MFSVCAEGAPNRDTHWSNRSDKPIFPRLPLPRNLEAPSRVTSCHPPRNRIPALALPLHTASPLFTPGNVLTVNGCAAILVRLVSNPCILSGASSRSEFLSFQTKHRGHGSPHVPHIKYRWVWPLNPVRQYKLPRTPVSSLGLDRV